MRARFIELVMLSLFMLAPAGPAVGEEPAAEPPRVVLLENSDRSGPLHSPLLISNKRGYPIRCESQVDETAVLSGLGVLSLLGEKMTILDLTNGKVELQDDLVLCPRKNDDLRLFTFAGEYYMQFPTRPNEFYRPGCNGLVEALRLDLKDAKVFDPRPLGEGQIHAIQCLAGKLLPPSSQTFAGWCSKANLTDAEKRTVLAVLEQTPTGPQAFGNEVECAKAQEFLAAESNIAMVLTGLGLTDLSPLSSLTHLTTLNLADNQIEDISVLEKLTKLVTLDLSGNRIENISTLKLMPGLTDVNLRGNRIGKVRPLASNQELTRLTLAGNQIADVSPLRFLQKLTVLDLAGNQIADAAPLTTLGALTTLNLNDNRIESIQTVKALSEFDLSVRGNGICQFYEDSDWLALVDICSPSGLMLWNASTERCLAVASGNGDSDVPIMQMTCDDDASRRWRLVKTSDGYQIRNMRTRKCLTIKGGGSNVSNLPAVQSDCDDDRSRRWSLLGSGSGHYQVMNLETDKCLVIAASGGANGDYIRAVQYECDDDRLPGKWVLVMEDQ